MAMTELSGRTTSPPYHPETVRLEYPVLRPDSTLATSSLSLPCSLNQHHRRKGGFPSCWLYNLIVGGGYQACGGGGGLLAEVQPVVKKRGGGGYGGCSQNQGLLNEEAEVHHHGFAPASVYGVTVFTGKPNPQSILHDGHVLTA